jgi:hypothetical protein
VYRGQLGDGRVVAVKKLRPLGGTDEDLEFLSEVRELDCQSSSLANGRAAPAIAVPLFISATTCAG